MKLPNVLGISCELDFVVLSDMSPTTIGTGTSELYSEKGLMPTFNDLDHMFESDSESSDADAVSFSNYFSPV